MTPILSPDEQRALLASIERVKARAGSELARIDDAGRAITFIVTLHRAVDQVVARTEEEGPASDCKPGCAYCCALRVAVSPAEAFRIARAVRDFPTERVERLVDRMRTNIVERSVHGETTRRDCAFLDDRRCTIYDLRPATCRKAHSLSVEPCRTFAGEVPQNLRRVVETEALIVGTSQAYRDAGLASDGEEMNAAVLAAIVDPARVDRWYESKVGG